jgi:sporulation protein YlmC with PRC-barrel domain
MGALKSVDPRTEKSMKSSILIAAMLALAPLPAFSQVSEAAPPSRERGSESQMREGISRQPLLERLFQTQFGERMAQAIDNVREACADDIERFCGSVTPGEGRLAMCMRAHEDVLSRRCEFALWRAARGLGNAVERVADTCLNEIQTHCGSAESIGQCIMEKRAQLSPVCQTVIGVLQTRGQAQMEAALRGMPVFSSDDRNVGQVAEVIRTPDGKIQSIKIDVGRMLGIGSKIVTVDAERFQQLPDRIRLRLSGDEVRSLPETKTQ